MKTLPLAHVKAHLSRLVDQVVETDEEIVITRNGRPAAVLVSSDEYEGWRETQAIRSDRELVAEIQRGLRMLKRGAKIYTLEELTMEPYRVGTDRGACPRSSSRARAQGGRR